jgi:hypothetical protein
LSGFNRSLYFNNGGFHLIKYFFVIEPKNNISAFREIAVLPSVSASDMWAIMPKESVALNNHIVMTQLEINHKLFVHNNLLIVLNGMFVKCCRHCFFNVRALAGCETLKVAKYAMLLAAIFSPTTPTGMNFKFFAAMGACNFEFFFPHRAVFALMLFAYFYARAFLGAISLHLCDAWAHTKHLVAPLACLCCKFTFFMILLAPIASAAALLRAEFCLSRTNAAYQKRVTAFSTLHTYMGCAATPVATVNMIQSFAVAFVHENGIFANRAREILKGH